MKKLITFTLALAIAGFSVSAQQNREMNKDKKGQSTEHSQKGHMMKDLNLTDAQKAELKANKEANKAKMEALKKEENITVKEMRERKKAIHDNSKKQMDATLTADQKAKMAAKKGEMGDKRDAKLKENLGLSNDQAAKLKAQNLETQAKVKAIQSNDNLTREQKQEQMKAVKAAAKTQRSSILNAEQMKKMDEMKKHKRGGHKGMREGRRGPQKVK